MDHPAQVDFVSITIKESAEESDDFQDAEEDHNEHPTGSIREPRGVLLRDCIDHTYLQAVARKVEDTKLVYYWGINGKRQEVCPRWMRTKGLHSEAMLRAFKGFIKTYSTNPVMKWLPLRMIVHQGNNGGHERIIHERSQGTLAPVMCRMPECEKCARLQGGCTFRWCADEWIHAYAFHKRQLEKEEEITNAYMCQAWSEGRSVTGDYQSPTAEWTLQCAWPLQRRPGQIGQRRQKFITRQRNVPAPRRRRGCNGRPHNHLARDLGGARTKCRPTTPPSEASEPPPGEAMKE